MNTKNKINIEKEHCCCATGHRAQKLPWKFNENDFRCFVAKEKTKTAIHIAVRDGYKYFMSGMALGFDMIFAEVVLELKKEYPHIQLVCVIPCKNQYELWPIGQQERYHTILEQADQIICLNDTYTKNCMLERNDFMLEHSSRVIALFNGLNGGTKSTILKAEKMDIKTIIIKP